MGCSITSLNSALFFFKAVYYHILLSKWPKSMINKIASCFYLNLLLLWLFVLRARCTQNIIKKLFNGNLLGNRWLLQAGGITIKSFLFIHPIWKFLLTLPEHSHKSAPGFYKAFFLNESGFLIVCRLNSELNSRNTTSLHPDSHTAAILYVTSQHESTWFKNKDAFYTQNT